MVFFTYLFFISISNSSSFFYKGLKVPVSETSFLAFWTFFDIIFYSWTENGKMRNFYTILILFLQASYYHHNWSENSEWYNQSRTFKQVRYPGLKIQNCISYILIANKCIDNIIKYIMLGYFYFLIGLKI